MSKKIVKLTESEIRQIISETLKNILTESKNHPLKEPYYNLINAIDSFVEILEQEYDSSDYEVKEAYDALMVAKDKVDDLVAHPDMGGGKKTWDVASNWFNNTFGEDELNNLY